MDPVQALALLSLGAFVTVLVTALFYIFTVRPRLLDPVPPALVNRQEEAFLKELAEQRAVIDQLKTALAHHTAQLAASASRAPSVEGTEALQRMLRAQASAVESLTALLNDHTTRLAGLDNRLGRQETAVRQVSDTALPGLSTQIGTQSEKLDRVEGKLDSHLSAPAPALDTAPLSASIQAQADRLVAMGARFDEWAATLTGHDAQLAEHARILADLDRRLAEQAQVAQQLDAKASEHTAMLVTAAAERRKQAGILERIGSQIGQLFPLINQIISNPPRPDQDRLTDIKGIGPVYASKLYEAGIYTFRQLAALTPEELDTLIGAPRWRAIDAGGWIEQAEHFASQREKVESLL